MTDVPQTSPDAATRVESVARALLAAVRSWSLYPPEHPAVGQALERLQRAVATAAEPSGLVLGVTPEALLVGGAAFGAVEGPVREAAALLHDRDILSLACARDVPADALRRLLALLTLDVTERRRQGGPAAWWAVHGHAAIAIEQIDYARVLEERPVEHAARRDALWRSLVRAVVERRPAFDEAAQQRLLEIAGDPGAIAAFAQDVVAPHCTPEGAPLLATQAAAVLAAYKHLLEIVGVLEPDRVDEVTRHLAAATEQLDPRVVLQMFQNAGQNGPDSTAGGSTARRVAEAFDEAGAARLLATTLALERRPSDRLAAVLETLAPDPPRRQRVLTLARSLIATQDFARSAHPIDGLRSAMEELVLKANEEPFVSAEYRGTLDGATDRAAGLASRELPPELPEWLATVGHDQVRHLSVTLLRDLLHLECDSGRAAELVDDMRRAAEDFLLANDYVLARRAIEPLAELARATGAHAGEACRAALAALAGSSAYRDAAALLGEMSDQEVGEFTSVSRALGPATVASLRDALLPEHPTRGSRRAADLIVGFGADAVPHLAPLAHSPRWQVQRALAAVLGRIAEPAAVPLLHSLLRSTEPLVLREAIRALCRIDHPSAARAIHMAMRATARDARRTLVEVLITEPDARLVPLLGRILDESDAFGRDYTVVIDTVDALARLEDDRAVPSLVRLMYRRRWWARRRARRLKQAAVDALVRIGSSRALAAVAEASQRGDRLLRKLARAARQEGTAPR